MRFSLLSLERLSPLRASGIAKVLEQGESRRSGGFTEETDEGKDQGRLGVCHCPIAIIYYRDNKQSIIHDVRKRVRVLHDDEGIQ
jgi:hypothetical protein